jgi:hypothetical protein
MCLFFYVQHQGAPRLTDSGNLIDQRETSALEVYFYTEHLPQDR